DRPGQFQRYLLSKSPKRSETGPGFSRSSSRGERGGSGGSSTSRVFDTFGGSGSASMRSSIDAHLTAAVGRFYSNTDGGGIPVPMAASLEAGSQEGRKWSGSSNSHRQLHGDGDDRLSSSSAGDRGMADRRQGDHASAPCRVETAVTSSTVAAAAAAAAAAAEAEAVAAAADANKHPSAMSRARAPPRAPVLAPGAPTIDGHIRRFGAPTMEQSPSSFASTSFESGASETSRRRRRSDQARVLASWRNSTGSTGFSGSRSRRTMSRVSSSGGVTPTNQQTPAPVGNRARGKMFRRKSSEALNGGVSFVSLQSNSSATSGGGGKGGPAELRRLRPEHSRSYSSGQIDLKMLQGFGDFPAATEGPDGQKPIVGDSRTLGTNWVGQNARGGWPLDLPASSAMPRWWIEHASRSGGDSSHGLGGGGGG
ncbi:unnamed protein product, partial [Ectocarpus sp. 12 AP-2014]